MKRHEVIHRHELRRKAKREYTRRNKTPDDTKHTVSLRPRGNRGRNNSRPERPSLDTPRAMARFNKRTTPKVEVA